MVERIVNRKGKNLKKTKFLLNVLYLSCLKDFAESLETKLLVYQSVHKMEFFIQAPSIQIKCLLFMPSWQPTSWENYPVPGGATATLLHSPLIGCNFCVEQSLDYVALVDRQVTLHLNQILCFPTKGFSRNIFCFPAISSMIFCKYLCFWECNFHYHQ